MATAYIKRVSEENDVPIEKLEAYWAKAKSLAEKYKDKGGVTYWRYVTTIFKNIAAGHGISVSAAFESISKKVSTALKSMKVPKKKSQVAKPAKVAKPKKPVTAGKKPPAKKAKTDKAVKLPEWWVKLSEKSKAAYVAKHPASKFVRQVASKNPALKKVLVKAQKDQGIKVSADEDAGTTGHDPETAKKVNDQIKKMHPGEQKPLPKAAPKSSIAEVPDEDPEVMPAGGHPDSVVEEKTEEEMKAQQKKHKSIFHRAYFKARQKISHTLTKDKIGRHCVGKFLTGHKLSEKDSARAKGWAMMAAKLVVGVAVGAAMFTPLAAMAPELGEHFMNILKGEEDTSESSGSDENKGKIVPIGNPEHFEATDFTDRLQQWLMDQDIPTLIETLKKEQEK